jgi:hypothetical protein
MIYFIQDIESKHIKIGYTKNIKSRISNLQVGSSSKLKLLGYISGDLTLEKEIHYIFREFTVRGEWFRVDQTIIDYLNSNTEQSFVVRIIDKEGSTQRYRTMSKA